MATNVAERRYSLHSRGGEALDTIKEIAWWLVIGPGAIMTIIAIVMMVGAVLFGLVQYGRERLRGRGAAILVLLVGAAGLAFGWFGKGLVARWRKGSGGTVSSAQAAGQQHNRWTPEERASLRAGFLSKEALEIFRGMEGAEIFAATQEDREAFADCNAGGIADATPEGPKAFMSMPEADKKQVLAQVGEKCAKEFWARWEAATTWSPQFARGYVLGCVKRFGEVSRQRCECVAEEAPKAFASPAVFLAVERTYRETKTVADHDRPPLDRIGRRCSPGGR
jgi:hypothetical protein